MKASMIVVAAVYMAAQFFTSTLFYKMVGVDNVGPASFRGVIPSHGESIGAVYLEGEHPSRDAEYVHGRCADAASNSAQLSDVAYVICYVNEMVSRPARLCDQEVKARFVRYAKAYFYIWAEQAVLMKNPAAQQMMRMQRQMDGGGDVESGVVVQDIDTEILDGFEALAKKGVLSAWDFGGLFSPTAPQTVKARLADIKPEGNVCK